MSLIDFILHIDDHLITIVNQFGGWSYLILFAIIFIETGLVVFPFLPGDSLIFAASAMAANPKYGLNIWLVYLIVAFAAIIGDSINYEIGAWSTRAGEKHSWFNKLINQNNAVVFIYPVFWGEAPSKLVGWFQRVWTYGFAYGNNASMKQLDKVLMLVTMGGDLNEPIRQAEVEAMKVIMFENRIGNRSKEKEMVVFDRMSRDYVNRSNNFNNNLKRAYCLGKNF